MPVLREFWLWLLLLVVAAVWVEQDYVSEGALGVAHRVFHAVTLYCTSRWTGHWWWKRARAQRLKDAERARVRDAAERLAGTKGGFVKPLWPQGE
jgi:hypothetical protein